MDHGLPELPSRESLSRWQPRRVSGWRSEIVLEWGQVFRIWNRENCDWNTWEFDYKGYYKEEHPTATVQVNRSGSGKSKNSE
jgi:hypothetical protein